MKKLFVFVLLIVSVQIFSQETPITKQENASVNSTIYDSVDKIPIYPGGMDAFRRNFYLTFDGGKINGRGKIKSEAIFVVGQDGYITDVEIKGDNKSMNKEMERAIKAMSKSKWSPATIDGEPVKYRYRFPISMNLP